eukprot:m.78953 g.78953  ORF g.78953 m.78953 type:complete len:183 (+) comp14507_c0_seq50:1603-2151(+)
MSWPSTSSLKVTMIKSLTTQPQTLKATGKSFEQLVTDYTTSLQTSTWSKELADFVWCDLARFCQQHERFEAVLEPLRLALTWFKSNLGSHVSTAACGNMIGGSYLKMHQYEAARDEFQASVDMMRSLENQTCACWQPFSTTWPLLTSDCTVIPWRMKCCNKAKASTWSSTQDQTTCNKQACT